MHDPKTVKTGTSQTVDIGKVRIGGLSPSLPVRVAPADVADTGKVRIGGLSPSL